MTDKNDSVKEYKYNAVDVDMKNFEILCSNRLGDGSGHHADDYIDHLNMLIEINAGGSMIDIGCGLGRVLSLVNERMSEVVGLEPDRVRWENCKRIVSDSNCSIYNQMSHEYIAENKGKQFDIVVLSMVIQHVSTLVCQKLLNDAFELCKTSGVVVVATTLVPKEGRGFSYQLADESEKYLPLEVFDAYAANTNFQNKGVPVRRFSKEELLTLLETKYTVVLWRQFSYIKPTYLGWFAKNINIEESLLKDVGISQYVILKKK